MSGLPQREIDVIAFLLLPHGLHATLREVECSEAKRAPWESLTKMAERRHVHRRAEDPIEPPIAFAAEHHVEDEQKCTGGAVVELDGVAKGACATDEYV